VSERGPRRVLYSFPHPLGSPGIGTIAQHQVDGLVALGHEVTVMCTTASEDVPGAEVIETMRVAGRRVAHRAVGVDRAWDYHDRRVAGRIRRQPHRWELVHAWPLSARYTFTAARDRGMAALREVPNTHRLHAEEVVRREALALGLATPARHSHQPSPRRSARELREYESAHLMLVPSDVVARTFLDAGIPEERLGRHQYGCDLDRFTPRAGDRPVDRPFTASFVGRCEPRKGLHYALQAWRDAGLAAAGGSFVICGSFVDGYREHLGPLLHQEGVQILGFVDDVPALLRSSDVMLLPSIEEGSALVTYEAQAAGCVLLVSRETGARCEDGREGLLHDAGDTSLLTAQLRAVADDPAMLARLRSAALAQRNQLGWGHAAVVLAGCYEQALRRARP